MAYTFLVLLGCLISSGNGTTFGTGFIVEYKNQLFIVSCKHVYHEVTNKNAIFVIPNPKQTLSPRNGYTVINLGTPYFHPNDNDNVTYDIVAFKLLEYDKPTLLANGIIPLQIMSDYKNRIDNTNELFSIGYPVDYANSYIIKNNEDQLPPKLVKGYLHKVNMKILSQNGFIGKLEEGHFIKTSNGDTLGKGASGGLVFIKKQSSPVIPIGLILGEADIKLSFSNNIKENVHYIVYAKMERVIEVLDKIN